MAPVTGSAYTYAYTTLGEIFAWFIGWDLILEYSMGCATVASAWSGYFNELLTALGLPAVSARLSNDPGRLRMEFPASSTCRRCSLWRR